MEALVQRLVEANIAQQTMYRELMGVLTAGLVGMDAGAAVYRPATGDEAAGDDEARDDTAHGKADALSRRDALGSWTATTD